MTEVITDSGEHIVTNLPAESVADIQAKPEPATPAPEQPAPAPVKAEEPVTPAPEKAEVKPEPETAKSRKATPIANLLSKLSDERIARETAERRATEAEAKLSQPTPPSTLEPKTDTEIEALAKKHGIEDSSLIKDVIEAARKGISSPQPQSLPKEISDLLAERKMEAEQKAELSAFDTRVTKLGTVFKDEPIGENKDTLLELAYSTDKAPDGERYCDKELSELYFGFIKPTIEPGTVSAETGRGATGGGTKVIDFQEILDRDDPRDIEAMDDTMFKSYSKWMTEKQGNVPIRRAQ